MLWLEVPKNRSFFCYWRFFCKTGTIRKTLPSGPESAAKFQAAHLQCAGTFNRNWGLVFGWWVERFRGGLHGEMMRMMSQFLNFADESDDDS